MAAQAYKVHMLQARKKAMKANRDARWSQNYASRSRIEGEAEYNPEWQEPPGILDSARPFPSVPYNTDSGISQYFRIKFIR
jgi:hypothetical protein